jgi:4-amino-4-deoxy-L-arabinose transferase-like glycosyltransferase
MKIQSMNKSWRSILGDLLLPILVALIFFAFTFSYYPFREKIQFDTDEGLNLMRSMLVTRGYALYSEVSSDQPPFFTQILGVLFRVVGFEVNPARILVLLFSSLLVWSGVYFLQLTSGRLSAILFLPLVIIVPRYLELSISVMIGIPSIALAGVSMLFIALWHKNRNNLWLALSGFALAFSVLIKLFSGFLVPVFLIGTASSMYFENRNSGVSWKILGPALIWGISFASLLILLVLTLVGPRNLELIIFPHIEASSITEFQGERNTINFQLQTAVPLILLGLLGTLVSVYKRNWLLLYPLAWAALAYILFSFHSPVFYHHQLLVTIPLTMLASAGVGDGVLAIFSLRHPSDFIRPQTLMGVAALIGFVMVTSHYLLKLDKELLNSPRISGSSLVATPGKLKVISTMNEYIDRTNWIMTDMPMYAFRVHKPVPPSLATFSQKRLITGSLTDEDILAAMREYHPEQVLMARFEIPALEAYLQENYTLILSEEFFRLFIRNDLALETK